MCSAGADAGRERFETLTDSHDEGARYGGTGHPSPRGGEGLQAGVGGHLQEVGRQYAVFVGADALGFERVLPSPVGGEAEGGDVGVFDDF